MSATLLERPQVLFATNLYNSFDIILDLFSTLFRVSSTLGFQNVYVPVYENGSSDQKKPSCGYSTPSAGWAEGSNQYLDTNEG